MIAIAVLELLTAVGLILFWIGFFTIGLAPKNPPQGYLEYEHSFPLPDGLLAILLLVAGILLLLNNTWGSHLSLIAAGALIFLGVLDFSFNIQNGIYKISKSDLILNAFLNVWCVGFGVAIAIVIV
ncbi:MAG: hypothetical protein ABSF74_04225 [Dehalococcoidia bacterium]|jgi:hypothetical protein